MPYLPETDELLFDDEERSWVTKNASTWEYMTGVRSPYRRPDGTLGVEGVARELTKAIGHLRLRKYQPAVYHSGVATSLIGGRPYADLHIGFVWDKATDTYQPSQITGRRKGGRSHDILGHGGKLSGLTFPESRIPNDRVAVEGAYWNRAY